MSKLSFIASGDRKYIVSRVLSLIKSDIVSRLKDADRVVIKPYIYSPDDQLSSAHADALESILEFISPHISKQVVIASGAMVGDTMEAFKKYNYFKLQDLYDFAIVDLNNDELIDNKLSSQTIRIPKTLMESDCIISLSPPRTDEQAIFSGSIANFIDTIAKNSQKSSTLNLVKKFAFPKNSSFRATPEFYKAEIVKEIFELFPVSFSVIDGYSFRKKSDSSSHLNAAHWASASLDTVSNDCLACQLLGIEIAHVDYLHLMAPEKELENNIVVGDDWRQSIASS